jgi:Ca2+-binding RTX toxin-like protein
MTRVDAYRAINMENIRISYGAVDNYDSDSITISAGASSSTYRGNFSYDIYGNVFGQLAGFEQVNNGQTIFEASGIRANAYTVFRMINNRDADAVLEYCLRFGDRIAGSAYGDTLLGYGGNDRILGNGGFDELRGMGGSDTLSGGLGADKLIGGVGVDRLDGGRDAYRDTFIFEGRFDSGATRTTRDRILNFDRGEDVIDLRLFDIGFRNKPAADSVWIADFGPSVLVHVDVTGDGRSDFSIVVEKVQGLGANDFLL